MAIDPFDMLKSGLDGASNKIDQLIKDVAGLKVQQKITWILLMLFVSGVAGTFFVIIQTIIKSQMGS